MLIVKLESHSLLLSFSQRLLFFDDYLFNIIHFLQAYADNVTQLYWIYREAKSLPSQCPP